MDLLSIQRIYRRIRRLQSRLKLYSKFHPHMCRTCFRNLERKVKKEVVASGRVQPATRGRRSGMYMSGNFPDKFIEAAENSKPREKNSAHREGGSLFYLGATNDLGGSQHIVESTYPQPNVMTEVVTQLTTSSRAKENICNAIMTNIGLNSLAPTLRR